MGSRVLWAKILLLLLLLAVVLAQVAYIGRAGGFGLFETADFTAYWGAARLLWQQENLYDPARLYEVQQQGCPRDIVIVMNNPPWTPVPFLPLLLLPFAEAFFAWFFLNLALLLLAAAALWWMLAPESLRRHMGIPWLAALTMMPALFTLRNGQTSILILLGVVGFLFFVERGRDELAGLSLTLTLIKPHIVYLLLLVVVWWIVRERRWRIVLGGGITMAVWIGVTLLISPHSMSHYLYALQHVPPTVWRTATLGSYLRNVLGAEHTWLQFIFAGIGAVLGGLYLLLRRPALHWPRDVSPILLLAVLTSAYGWTYDQVVLLPAYLQMVVWIVRPGPRLRRAALAAALLAVNGLMLLQNQRGTDEVYLVWTAPAWVALYLAAWRALGRAGDLPPGADDQAQACGPVERTGWPVAPNAPL